jgi:outer membrane protein assembly factor BamB
VKQVKILFLFITVAVFALILPSCAPGGTQPTQGWSGAVFHNGIVYVGSMDGKIVAVNASTPGEEWSHAISMPAGGLSCGSSSRGVVLYGTPVVAENLICIGTYDGRVYAMNSSARSQGLPFPHRGSGEWLCSLGQNEPIVSSLVLGGDTIYASSSDGKVYALTFCGDPKWKSKPLGEKLWTSPTIDGDTIYMSTYDGYIYALPTEETEEVEPSWVFKADAGFASSPVVYGDTIFAGSFDRNLYAVKIGYAEPMWEFHGGGWFWAAPLVRDGVVYAGCLDGKVYALDADSGDELWEPFDAGSPIVAPPIFIDDSLVVASESGNVYVIDSETGIGEQIRNPAGDNRPSIDASVKAPLCAHEGIVYIRAQDNCLYAVNIEQGRVERWLSLTAK